jgi:membrane fusion protein, multidrug efflux system
MKQTPLTKLEELEPIDRYNGRNGKKLENNGVATDEVVDEATEDEAVDEPSPKPRSKKRRGLLLVVGGIVLVVGTIAGLRWWQFQRTHVSTDNAQIQGHLSPLAPKISATVQQVLVEEGERVKAGQPLVMLEDRDLPLKVQQAEAELANAKAQLNSAIDTVKLTSQTNPTQVQQARSRLAASLSAANAAKASVSQAQAVIETNQAKIAQAQTEINLTQTDYRRYQTLYKAGAISAQQFDSARAAYENAQASLTAARKTVAQSQAELNNAQAQLQKALAEADAARGQVQETQVSGQNVTVQRDRQQQAQAQVKQATAALALARQQLTYTAIKAPVDGYIGQLTAQVGQKVQVGQPLLSVVPLKTDEVYVEANFKETALGKLQIGEKADVEVDAYPGETFHATIAGISPATGASFALLPPDNATGNFNKVVQWVPVRLVFDSNTDGQNKLRPGLNATVTVDTTTVPELASTTPN